MIPALHLSAIPLIVALCSVFLRRLGPLRLLVGTGALAQVLASLWIAVPVFRGEEPPSFFVWFRFDSMAAWIVCVNTLVYAASILSASMLFDRPELLHLKPKAARAFFALSSLFLIAANAVVCAADLGAMWVAMEATTLVTAPLILLSGTRESVEAAWKYLVLCGVGIAFALLGIIFFLAAGGSNGSLGIGWLTNHAQDLKRTLLNTGFVFFLLGYGTKAGLFPMHNWLPDAHSEAPPPASALLSGALLNCAMVALWRVAGIVQFSDLNGLLTNLVAPMGAITVFAAAVMLIRQRSLKRMWAYSSIENMGLLAVAVGLGAGPAFALHSLAHSLAKSSAFLLSGNILRSHRTVMLNKLSGVMRRSPGLGFTTLAAGAAVMGAPPFASFMSEWLLIANVADGGHWGIFVAIISGLAISFVAVMVHVGRVVFGEKKGGSEETSTAGSILPSVVLLVASAIVFIAVAPATLAFLYEVFPSVVRP